MSDARATSSWVRWRTLGRLLPSAVRERVFEPAFADLLREALEFGGTANVRVPFAVRALGTYAGCLPQSLIRLFVVSGRTTRFARVLGVVLAVGAVLRVWLGAAYGPGP